MHAQLLCLVAKYPMLSQSRYGRNSFAWNLRASSQRSTSPLSGCHHPPLGRRGSNNTATLQRLHGFPNDHWSAEQRNTELGTQSSGRSELNRRRRTTVTYLSKFNETTRQRPGQPSALQQRSRIQNATPDHEHRDRTFRRERSRRRATAQASNGRYSVRNYSSDNGIPLWSRFRHENWNAKREAEG